MKNKQFIQKNMSVKKPIKQKKTLSYWVVVIALAFMFVSSFLGTYAFIKTVSAEETPYNLSELELSSNSVDLYDTSLANYSFDSSSIMVTSARFMYSTYSANQFSMSSQNYFSNIRFSLYQYNGDLLFYPSVYVQGVANPPSLIVEEHIIEGGTDRVPVPHLYPTYNTSVINYNGLNTYKINKLGILDKDSPYGDSTDINFYSTYSGFAFRVEHSTLSGAFQLFLGIGYEEGLIPVFNSVRIYTRKIWDNATLTAIYYNIFDYYDINGKLFRIFAPFSGSTQSKVNAYGFTDRTYYLSNSFTDNENYQNGLEEGYRNGYSDGQDIGFQDGYDSGRKEGQAIGKQEGYNEGIRDANQYSFLNLLGAVVDAPIQALSGLLNFDILGFNMLNFFLSLLTLALIIFVVRMFL